MTAAYTQCRYLRANGEQCTAEAVDADAEILLCLKHFGRASKLILAARRLGLVAASRAG